MIGESSGYTVPPSAAAQLEQAFRGARHFTNFFDFVRPYFSGIAEIKHDPVRDSGLSGRAEAAS